MKCPARGRGLIAGPEIYDFRKENVFQVKKFWNGKNEMRPAWLLRQDNKY
jgi:hypothetical protein